MKKRMDRSALVFLLSTVLFLTIFATNAIARDTVADEFTAIQTMISNPPNWTFPDYTSWKDHAYSAESMPLAGERDPVDVQLRRTRTLLDEFNTNGTLASLDAALTALEAENNTVPVSNTSARLALFREVDALSRKVAFANPLLNFKDIVFLKRNFSRYNHMIDSYFGHKSNSGGGIYILENAFSDNPTVRDVLANAVLENGRYQGQSLGSSDGCFSNPTLSYDGKTIYFSYTKVPIPLYWDLDGWNEDRCFHLYKVNVDGTGLRQLTDGPYNDLHPYPLPNGRIVFTSERSGGYGRCHERPCRNYTLYTANADGTDITPFSAHETNEWHPSVDNNGMVIYSRWDYVDRGANQAHHPWVTYPDGRDARAIQGNWKPQENANPQMEQHVRAIPGSDKYVATATPHHGQAFGSFVLIDPRVEDDGIMSSLKILTPEALFPEVLTGVTDHWKFATAWPLSERFYLCGYDPYGNGTGSTHALTLLDAKTGLKTTIYHDPGIPCYHPTPLRVRPVPPLIPNRVASGKPLAPGQVFDPSVYNNMPTTGNVALMDVYDSRLPLPDGVEITHLRIIEILPKTTWDHVWPHVGYGHEDPARRVLGTVPVEADGSAYFTVPADKPIYLQALNADGLAVQSMRSVTYAKPGDTLTCAGCHEKQASAPIKDGPALALQRSPSIITPEAEGSNPFSFPRLVQPVLDAKCVSCHQTNGAIDLTAGNPASDSWNWSASYRNLANYAFYYGGFANESWYYDLWNDTGISTPGQVGAMGSRLYQEILTQNHHGLTLSSEEMHRLTLWLDSNSDFFGAYENTLEQAQGQVVEPFYPRATDWETVANTDYTQPAIPAEPPVDLSNNNGLSEFGSPLELRAPLLDGQANQPVTLGQADAEVPLVEAGPDDITYVNGTIQLNGEATIGGQPVVAGSAFVQWTQITGPIDAVFQNTNAFSTLVQFPQPGSYLLRLAVNADGTTGSDEVLVTVFPSNSVPLVDAGPDRFVAGSGANIQLAGFVSDESPSVATAWTQTSGPDAVVFDDPALPNCSVSCPQPGTYVLRLTADDGQTPVYDECTVEVTALITNDPPSVFAGDDITTSYLNNPITLQGSASDDGVPSPLTITWSVISGPGTVSFGDASSPTTTANFSTFGYYLLQLTADDGDLTSYDQLAVYLTHPSGLEAGSITWEYWDNVNDLASLTSDSRYPDNPDQKGFKSTFEGPLNYDDYYGSRMHGYLLPQVSGNYTFWIASDDDSQLWLSSDDNPANANQIAYVSGWTDSRQWSKYSSQQSSSVYLQAGNVYYIMALQRDGNGGDNLAVAWQGPGISQQVIDGQYLAPYDTLAPSGQITREYWTGISGTDVSSLTSSLNYPDSPSSVDVLSSFEGPVDWDDDYGSRIHGFVFPPSTGSYTFWIASDDNSQLWLSTDTDPANAVQIASVPDWTNSQEWNKFGSQQSAPVTLTANQPYYILALQKEEGGGDNLAVAWQGPGISQAVIAGQYLCEYQGRVVWQPPASSGPVAQSTNRIPGVSAGPDLQIALGDTADLRGIADDDGLPEPAALSVQWQKAGGPGDVTFEDASSPVTTATFSEAGRYLLRLEVNDGEFSNSDIVLVTVGGYNEYDYFYPSPQEVAWSTDGTYLAAADAGLNRVVIIDAASQSVLHSIPVDGSPRGMIWTSPDELWVCEYDAGTIALIDVAAGRVVRRIDVGPKPYDIKYDSTRQQLVVTEYGLFRIRIVDISAGTTVVTVPAVEKPMYLALTPDAGKAVVLNSEPLGDARDAAYGSVVTVVDLNTHAESQIALPYGSTSLRGVAVSPDGHWAYVAHLLGRSHLPTTQLTKGWVFNNVVTILDLTSSEVYATVPLDAIDEGAANPWGLALSDNGDTLWVSGAGVHELISLDMAAIHSYLTDPSNREEISYDMITLYENGWIERTSLPGKGPRGLAMSPDGDTLAVAAYFAGEVYLFDTVSPQVTAQIATGPAVPEHALRRGERLYFDADVCFQRWLSCNSCHPGARSDGLNWDLLNDGIGNTKNTKSHLYSVATPPSMVTGIRPDVAAAIQAGYKFIQFQDHSMQDMQDSYDFLASLRPEQSPHLNKQWMTSEALSGKIIFDNRCASCHSSQYFTDQQTYDVGTGHPGDFGAYDPIYDTPTLHELWNSAPYLHDGSAPTLRDVLTTQNPGDQHGMTSDLSSTEIDELVAYLNQISGIDDWVNQAPVVEAGANQKIVSPTNAVQLAATASDEGLPASTLTGHWELVSGPDSVVFGDPTDPATDVTFTTAGEYWFEFIADDGDITNTDTVRVAVHIYAGDLTFDGKVNMIDMAELSQGWQTDYDMSSLIDVANDWMLGCY